MKKGIVFPFDQKINILFSNQNYHLSGEQKRIVLDFWEKSLLLNKNLFNGSVICLNKIEVSEDNMTLIFVKTDYAHFLASIHGRLPKKYTCRSLYVSSLIETNDNYAVFGRMGDNSYNKGRIQFIGGGVDHNYISRNTIDIYKCIEEELKEEINIDINVIHEVSGFQPLYICFGKELKNISIIFHVRLNLDSTALTEKLKNHNNNLKNKKKSLEVDELTFVNHSNYRSVIKKHIDHHLDDNLYASLDAFYENNISSDFSLIN